jgi:hypothetical protein
MHRCAHQDDQDSPQHGNCLPQTPPCEWCGVAAPLIEPGALWVVFQYDDGYYHSPCHDTYGRR